MIYDLREMGKAAYQSITRKTLANVDLYTGPCAISALCMCDDKNRDAQYRTPSVAVDTLVQFLSLFGTFRSHSIKTDSIHDMKVQRTKTTVTGKMIIHVRFFVMVDTLHCLSVT